MIVTWVIVCITLTKNSINFNHSIPGTITLVLVHKFNDLAVMFVAKFNLFNHTEMIKNKAMRNLRFIKRTYQSFNDSTALKTLYCTLVRSNLDYFPLIWITNTIK